MCNRVSLLGRCFAAVRAAHPGAEEKYVFHDALQAMQKRLVRDLIENTARNVTESGAKDLPAVRLLGRRAAMFSPQVEAERREEKQFLYDALYTCPALEREHDKAEDVVTDLFQYWAREPEELPEAYFAEIESEGLARVIADYIAGMTDNYILMQFADVRRRVRANGGVALPAKRSL